MAFVYRSRNKSEIIETTPGPGQYNTENQKPREYSSPCPKVPLIDLPRKISPGPGAYETNKLSTVSQLSSCVFRNDEDRFKNDKCIPIGPGYYDFMRQQQKQFLSQRPKIIESLLYAESYQQANSIPYEKRQQADVGPGYYDVLIAKHHSQVSDWSKKSTKPPEQNETTIGPGQYDIDRYHKFNEQKIQKKTYKSTTQTSEPKYYVKKGLDNKVYYSFQKSTTPDSDSSQYEYIEDSTPGPGYYSSQSTAQSTQAKFCNKAPRFAPKRTSIPGPGFYNPQTITSNQHIEFAKEQRFKYKTNKYPGPTSYSPKISMKDQIVQQLIQSPGQEVGSKMARFPKKKIIPSPGPGFYQSEYKEIEKQDVSLSPFKSKTNRYGTSRLDIPPVGTYNLGYGSIEEKIKSQLEYITEQLIEKPPFGMQEGLNPKIIQEEPEDEPIQRSSNFKPKEAKPRPAFGQVCQRFKDEINDNPDPLTYNLQMQWNKKTFNYMFLRK